MTSLNSRYLAGVGVGDITGPVADVNLMGYAQPLQTANGLHTRIYARAFIFADAANTSNRFVYVSMDACMAEQLVTMRVRQRLAQRYGPELYGRGNVAISGTHTHASPAGFHQYLLYGITSLGFVKPTFDAMVDGVVEAIAQAHDALRPAQLLLASGELADGSVNRSPTAYLANPEEERAQYTSDVDTDMTLIRVQEALPAAADPAGGASSVGGSTGGHGHPPARGLGALSWFAVHCTSLNNTNRLVSGDNKGAAQLAMEEWAAGVEARVAAAQGAGSSAEGAAAAAGGGGHGGGVRGLDEKQAALDKLTTAAASEAAAAAAAALLGLRYDGDSSSSTRTRAATVGSDSSGAPESAEMPLRFAPGFAAAVAQASVGDTSPNTQGAFCLDTGLPCDAASSTCNGKNELCHGRGPAWPNDRTSAAVIGLRQFLTARQLYEGAKEVLSGPIDYRHTFLDMGNITVLPSRWSGGRGGRTCLPAMGMSFAAGTTDGPGAFDFKQGDQRGPPLWRLLRNFVLPPTPEHEACHAPKPILLDTGRATFPYAWQPRITEISLLRLGQLLIACVPGELTSMAGRRLKAALKERFEQRARTGPGGAGAAGVAVAGSAGGVGTATGDAAGGGAGGRGAAAGMSARGEPDADGKGGKGGGFKVVISGLTGTYSSYVTTWEEYQVQRYEGASTLYGPFTLDAYIQEFLRLADAMLDGAPVASAVQPPDLQSKQVSLLTPVVVDWVPPGAAFGNMVGNLSQPVYARGDTVQATFRAANPRNNLRRNGTFMAVERLVPTTAASAATTAASAAIAAAATSSSEDSTTGEDAGLAGSVEAAAQLLGAKGDGGSGGRQRHVLRPGPLWSRSCEGATPPGTAWVVVHNDRDWITRFHWTRPFKLSPESHAALSWEVPQTAAAGTYRLHYWGDAKQLSQRIVPFEGCSPPFTVVEQP